MLSIATSRRRAISRLVVSIWRECAVAVIEIGGEPRAVGAERVQLGQKLFFVAVGLAAALHRGRKTVKRQSQTPGRRVDRAWIGHRLPFGFKNA